MAKKKKHLPRILLIDDEMSIRKTLKDILIHEDYDVETATNGAEGFNMIKNIDFNVVLCDIKMPKMDGMEFLGECRKLKPDLPVIMISGHGDIDTAVSAVKGGAYDYISKPPDLNRILITIKNALEKNDLTTETKTLRKQVSKGYEIIGESQAIIDIKETIEKVAPTEARVLITGDNGVGKESVAHWLHDKSERNDAPLVEVNCAAIPAELIESELFGHEKGSFTSAVKQRIGKFEQADGGTLFLDEIGDMSLSAQAKVLRALQEGIISRVGGDKEIEVNVRVIAATNKDLMQEIENNNFRMDLYHRLSVIIIHMPALKERKEDIPLLVDHFMTLICQEYGIAKKEIDQSAMKVLEECPWTGNVRELRNVIERLIILTDKKIEKSDVDAYVVPGVGG